MGNRAIVICKPVALRTTGLWMGVDHRGDGGVTENLEGGGGVEGGRG